MKSTKSPAPVDDSTEPEQELTRYRELRCAESDRLQNTLPHVDDSTVIEWAVGMNVIRRQNWTLYTEEYRGHIRKKYAEELRELKAQSNKGSGDEAD